MSILEQDVVLEKQKIIKHVKKKMVALNHYMVKKRNVFSKLFLKKKEGKHFKWIKNV